MSDMSFGLDLGYNEQRLADTKADFVRLLSGRVAIARVASTGNLTLSGLQTIDGVTVVAGDLILVKDQTTNTQNGLWVAAAGAWARANYGPADAPVGSSVTVLEGTFNSGSTWSFTTPNPSTYLQGTSPTIYVFRGGSYSRLALGKSATPSQNFLLTAEAADGTMKLARGNAGATLQDIITIASNGKVDFPQLLFNNSANGYKELHGGLIVQWGAITSSASAGAINTITFPIAFPNTVFTASAIASFAGTSTTSAWRDDLTNTQFKVRSSQASTAIYWFAIGN